MKRILPAEMTAMMPETNDLGEYTEAIRPPAKTVEMIFINTTNQRILHSVRRI